MTTCTLPRPDASSAFGHDPGQRPVVPVQEWTAPSGANLELAFEWHGDHAHLWWRVDRAWDEWLYGGQDDWDHFLDCVWPVARQVVDGLRCGLPRDAWSVEVLTPRPREERLA